MKTKNKLLTMGVMLLIAGITAASLSFSPSMILQYIFVGSSLTVGILGVLIGKNTQETFVRSTYYSRIGFVLIALSVAIVLWGTSVIESVNVLGFFFLLVGLIEFVSALQILTHETNIPWKIVGLKLTSSAMAAIGAASILTTAGFDGYMALLFVGLLFVVVGLTIVQISRATGNIGASMAKPV